MLTTNVIFIVILFTTCAARAHDIWVRGYFRFPAAILDLWFNWIVYSVDISIIRQVGPENMVVATGILFLSALEPEIHMQLFRDWREAYG